MNKPEISFAIIGHNEEHLLKDCFESIKDIAREIVYVDCESQDKSIELAGKYTTRIFKRENNLNININKQFAIDNSLSEWIFYIDPDERLTVELKKEIMDVIGKTDFDGFLIPRKNYYFGKWIRYGGKFPDRQLRLFRKGVARFECVSIHERIKVNGRVGYLKNPFIHIVIEDTRRLVEKTGSYIDRTSCEFVRLNINEDKKIYKTIIKFFNNYFLKLGFLDGITGFFVAVIDLFNGLLVYFRLKELRDKNKNG